MTTRRTVRGVDMDTVSRTEQVESDLTRLIEKRHDRRVAEESHRPSEELYQESCRRFAEARRLENTRAWFEFHDAQVRRHEVMYGLLVEHHRQERREYRGAESRIRESILLRDVLPDHTYPGRDEDLQTIHRYHSRYGIPPLGLWACAKRLLEGRGP
jgi:hypothetical protein